MTTAKKVWIVLACVLLLSALAAVILQLDYWFGSPAEEDDGERPGTVYFDGEAYRPKQMTNYLIIGLDEFGVPTESGSYNNRTQADFIVLLTMNHTDNTCSMLHLNRDTMTEVTQLGVTGEKTGVTVEQLTLSFTYGDGTHVSCRNTVEAVEKILKGIRIDYYVAVTMDAVSIVTDYVGGVPVTVTEDMTAIDPDFVAGASVTLSGAQALTYVRARQGLEDSSNLSRMERQKQYMNGLMGVLEQKKAQGIDESFVQGLYERTQAYMITNAGYSAFTGLFDCLRDYANSGLRSCEGRSVKGEEFMEFYIDEASLNAILKEWLYQKVNK